MGEDKYTDLSSKEELYTSESGTGILLKIDEETILMTVMNLVQF